jgi:hypothetical protein
VASRTNIWRIRNVDGTSSTEVVNIRLNAIGRWQ